MYFDLNRESPICTLNPTPSSKIVIDPTGYFVTDDLFKLNESRLAARIIDHCRETILNLNNCIGIENIFETIWDSGFYPISKLSGYKVNPTNRLLESKSGDLPPYCSIEIDGYIICLYPNSLAVILLDCSIIED